jgi:hypothetical protein
MMQIFKEFFVYCIEIREFVIMFYFVVVDRFAQTTILRFKLGQTFKLLENSQITLL